MVDNGAEPLSAPVAGPLAVLPLFVTAGDLLVKWDDPGQTWRSLVPAGAVTGGPYLPLTGGTLTGGLSINANLNVVGTTASGGGYYAGGGNPALDADPNYTHLHAPDAIGTNSAGIHIGSVAGAGGYTFHRSNGYYFQDGGATVNYAQFASTGTYNASGAWIVFSDPSIKEAIEPYTRGLDAILALEPVQFRYSAGTPFATEAAPSRPLFGLLADQVKPYVPEIVGETTATVRGVEGVSLDTLEPGLLVFSLINAVKTLAARLEALEGAAAAPS